MKIYVLFKNGNYIMYEFENDLEAKEALQDKDGYLVVTEIY